MFEELDRLLSEEISDDSWYDDGCLIAEDMMLEFSDADWKGLSCAAAHRSLAWQKKLAYCLDCCLTEETLGILDVLFRVDDEELSDICMDTLRSFDNECGHRYVQAHPEIMEKAKRRMDAAGGVARETLRVFQKTFGNDFTADSGADKRLP